MGEEDRRAEWKGEGNGRGGYPIPVVESPHLHSPSDTPHMTLFPFFVVNTQGPVLGHTGKDFHFLSAEVVPFPI